MDMAQQPGVTVLPSPPSLQPCCTQNLLGVRQGALCMCTVSGGPAGGCLHPVRCPGGGSRSFSPALPPFTRVWAALGPTCQVPMAVFYQPQSFTSLLRGLVWPRLLPPRPIFTVFHFEIFPFLLFIHCLLLVAFLKNRLYFLEPF